MEKAVDLGDDDNGIGLGDVREETPPDARWAEFKDGNEGT